MEGDDRVGGGRLSHLATREFQEVVTILSHRMTNNIISVKEHIHDNIGIYNVKWYTIEIGMYYSNIDKEWTRVSRTYFPIHLN